MKRLDESLSHRLAHDLMPQWLEKLLYGSVWQEPKIDTRKFTIDKNGILQPVGTSL